MLSTDSSNVAQLLPRENIPADIASNLKELALVYQSYFLFDDAKHLCRKALALETLFLGKNHEQVANTTTILARIYYEGGDLAQATLIYRQALSITERLAQPSDFLIWCILSDLAHCYAGQALYGEAR